MSFRLARRLQGLPQPATIAMSAKARALRAQGFDVISLALGEPDFASPPEAIAAAHLAGLQGDTKYPPVGGQPALKAAVSEKFLKENGLSYCSEEILIGNGGKQLIYNAFGATIDPGDEVIVPVPYWVSYPIIVQMMGGVCVYAPCLEVDRFRLRAETLRSAITSRTRWLVLNFPNNPSGAILERADLEAIAVVLRESPHVMVMADEIYEHLTFDGHRHESLASVAPDLKSRILTINGMAKAYAMTGWRVGFCAGTLPLIKAMTSMQSNATSGVCTLAQAGAVAALATPPAARQAMRDVYQRRRDLMVAALRSMPLVTCATPQGAFYTFPGIVQACGKTSSGGRRIVSDVDFADALLEEEHVSVVPGSAFGLSGFIRLSVAASDDLLLSACARLKNFLIGLH